MHLGGLVAGVLLAVLGLAPARAAPLDGKSHILSQGNFDERTATGTWVVKHYSPKCKHCKHFQPTWEKVVGARAVALGARGVHFGEVDCLGSEQLCEKNRAEAWPAVVVFRGGKRLGELVGDNSEEDLVRFVDSTALDGAAPAPAAKKYAENSVVLSAATYKQHAHKGIWLVKHYSPFCQHCRNMAPNWTQVTDELAADFARDGITFGEVNCIENRKLCEDNLVDGFPTINLFVDGKFIEEMIVKYEYGPMKKYMLKLQKRARSGELATAAKVPPEPVVANDNRDWDDAAEANAAPQPSKNAPGAAPEPTMGLVAQPVEGPAAEPAAKPAAAPETPKEEYNVNGEVVELTRNDYAERTAKGPWFIKFYAPWCPHCQELAPVWAELAAAAKGKVNIGSVNCDEEGKLCADHKVQGYPTLKLLWESESLVYKGSRDLDNMLDFVDSSLTQPRELRAVDDLYLMRNATDVVFVLAYDRADTRAGTKAALAHVKDNVRKMFLSGHLGIASDPAVARRVLPSADTALPALVAYKDGHAVPYKGALTSDDQLREWLYAERFPLLPEFVRENADSLFYDSDYLVLLVVDAEKGAEQANTHRDSVRSAALEYQRLRESPLADTRRSASVRFAWVDGGKWESYVDRVFRVRRGSLPAVVIVQSSEDLYFTTDTKGAPISPTRMGVFMAVRAAVDGRLKAQSTSSIIVRVLRAAAAAVLAVGAFFFGSALRTLLTLATVAVAGYYALKRGGRLRSASFGLVKAD
ncbi:hypothetical protein LPJ61_001583 [Coemansia biformis]|uniref:Thioredoxin domain-containing protein n=1 Tax=Coemansia biformis TaxID=1286918 RepID=A0A9W7YHE5_9FUNG|nr:hypothetical protein LPJ61_001583 [Coemansia biformis]